MAVCTTTTDTCTCRAPFGGGPDAGMTLRCMMTPPPCPAAPAMGGMCTAGTGGIAGCVSGADTCHCEGAGGGATWRCAATPLACPAGTAAGGTCTAVDGGAACTIAGGMTCTCGRAFGPDAGTGDVYRCF
jgi:hypothetical protein